MIVLVKSVCIVCSKEYESQVKDKEKSLPAILDKMWTVFVKYFNLTPEKWNDILSFYKQVRELPFCLICRNDVAQLLIFHDKLQTILQRIERITGNLSATIIKTSSNSQLDKSNNSSNNNEDEGAQIIIRQVKGENGEKTSANCDKMQVICNYQVNKEIRRLTQYIAQRYNPEIQMFNCLGKNVDDENISENEQNGFNEDLDDLDENGGGEEEGLDEDLAEDEEDVLKTKGKRKSTPGKLVINKKDTDCSLCSKFYSNTSNFRRHCLNVHGGYEIDTSETGTQRIDTTNLYDGAEVELDEDMENEEEDEEDDSNDDDTFEFSGWTYRQSKQGFVCGSCGITRGNREGLIKHIQKDHMSTPNRVLPVPPVQKCVKSVDLGNGKYSYLDKWIFEELPTGVWKCLACGNLAKSRKNQVLHIKNIHCPEICKFLCHVCNRGFKSRGALIKHKSKHEERRYRPKPGLRGTFIYDNKFEFTSTNSGFKCSTCTQETTHINYMALHIKFNHASKSKRAVVDDSFNSPLSKSQVVAQSTPNDAAVARSKPCKYVCNFPGCNAAFPKLIGLQVHKGMRHKRGTQSNFKCNVCSATFKFSIQLALHKKKFHNLLNSKQITTTSNAVKNKNNNTRKLGKKGSQDLMDMYDDDGDDFELDGIPPAKLQAMEMNGINNDDDSLEMDYDDLEDDALVSMPAADLYGSSHALNGNSEEEEEDDDDEIDEEEDDNNDDEDFSPTIEMGSNNKKSKDLKSNRKNYYTFVDTPAGRKFKCTYPQCQKKEKLYDSHTGIYLHSGKHAGIVFRCDHCKKGFSQKVQLQNHFRRQHPETPAPSKFKSSSDGTIRKGRGRPRLLTSSGQKIPALISSTTTAAKGIKRKLNKLKGKLKKNSNKNKNSVKIDRKLRERMVVKNKKDKNKKSKVEPEYYRTYKSSTRKSLATKNQDEDDEDESEQEQIVKSTKRTSAYLQSKYQEEDKSNNNNNNSSVNSSGSEEQKYSCTYEGCTKSYRSLAGYDLHMKQHAGNVLKCQFCSKEYVQLNGLQYHLRTVHNEKPIVKKGKKKLHWRTKARLIMEEEEQRKTEMSEQESEQEEDEEDDGEEMENDTEQNENETNEQNQLEQEEEEETENSLETSEQEQEQEVDENMDIENEEETVETEKEVEDEESQGL